MPYEIKGDLNCWEWTGRTDAHGTPIIRDRKGHTTARRRAWERENGPIPEGHVLFAYCSNGPCVRPLHHTPVTWEEWNYRSGVSKLNPRTAAIALRMRGLGMTLNAIAEHFDVSEGVISAIVHGTHWTQRKVAA